MDFLFAILRQETEGNWSVWEHDRIHVGDECFLLKVGCGATGIVKAGVVTSAPYVSGDWSGHGRTIYYVDFESTVLVNPDTLPILDSTTLEENLPDFDWRGGHSGVVLDDTQATVLRRLWNGYLLENTTLFQSRFALIEQRKRHNDQLYVEPKLWKKLLDRAGGATPPATEEK